MFRIQFKKDAIIMFRIQLSKMQYLCLEYSGGRCNYYVQNIVEGDAIIKFRIQLREMQLLCLKYS